MAPLIHIITHWRVLRYSSAVIQGLSQLGGQGQCVQQMEDGLLTLLVLCAYVSPHTMCIYMLLLLCTHLIARK